MRRLSKKSKILLFFSCLSYSVYALVIIALLYSYSLIISASSEYSLSKITEAVLLALGLYVLSYLVIFITGKLRYAFLSHAELELKDRIVGNLMTRSNIVFKEKESAYYINLLLTDTDTYREDFLDPIPLICNSFVTIVASAVMLYRFHPLLLLAGVGMAIVSMFIIKPFSASIRNRTEIFSKESEKYNACLRETIDAYDTIKLSGNEKEFQSRFRKAGSEKQDAWRKRAFLRFISFETLMSVAALSSIVALAIGAYLVYRGYFKSAFIFTIISYFTSLSNQFSNFSSLVVSYRSCKAIEDKLFQELEADAVKKSDKMLDFKKGIQVENLSFAYGDHQIFDHYTCEFENGKCYAVVGESGSGKSTLIKLLLKYFEDYQGQIRFAGHNLRELTEADIYGKVALVNQNPYIFDADLSDNITLFKEEKNQAAYEKAMERTNLSKLSSFVGDRKLGSFGDKISGGEKQRINIARVLYQEAELLIFDEPTTGLDPQNKEMIDQLIFDFKEKTRIVITHNWDKTYLDRFDGVYVVGK